jgi:hypothetical protein
MCDDQYIVLQVTPFAQTAGTIHHNLGADHHMTTHATLFSNGLLIAVTTVYTFSLISGFKGGVQVVGIDGQGKLLFTTETIWLRGKGLLLSSGYVLRRWRQTVNPSAACQTVMLGVAHFRTLRLDTVRRAIEGSITLNELRQRLSGATGVAFTI